MELILYITGGIALLALAWLFISIATTVSSVKDLMVEVRGDLAVIVQTVSEVKAEVVPILGNVNTISSNVTSITSGIQAQMINVQETIDDALDVVRGTIDDLERLKDQVVETVEGPIAMVRSTTDGAIGAIGRILSILGKFSGKNGERRKRATSENGRE